MKPFVALAVFAFAVLGAAAVWMGGLNQDEGWYLYAAQLVADGQVPYRDFFYTQGPLLPVVYSAFACVWKLWGLLGARILTLAIGAASIVFAVALARRSVPEERRAAAGTMAFLLLGSNLYHLYYLAIPKTYALAALFVLMGFYLLSVAVEGRAWIALAAALSLAFASGARISLGMLLAVVGLAFLFGRRWRLLAWFCLGGFAGLALVYGPFLWDAGARAGLIAAQQYHAARGGFDPVWTVGSVSRLVRWYLPVFVLLGLHFLAPGTARQEMCSRLVVRMAFFGFVGVFAVQMLAPFPYEDYQVPVMGLLAVFVAVSAVAENVNRLKSRVLVVLGMTWACSFGSPLLEKWSTNGQVRFWSLKKSSSELAQLRDAAREINALDPGGKDILTQDLYLAIETGRKVPRGLEMGPFSMLNDSEWRTLLHAAPCRIAALSGYSFAIVPPVCSERPVNEQMEYWSILKRNYQLVSRVENFGQNQTTLLVLKKK